VPQTPTCLRAAVADEVLSAEGAVPDTVNSSRRLAAAEIITLRRSAERVFHQPESRNVSVSSGEPDHMPYIAASQIPTPLLTLLISSPLASSTITELFPTCLGFAELQNVDGLGEFPGAPGAAAELPENPP